MTPAKQYAISWRTRDRNLIHRVCSYLGIEPYMNVNRITYIRKPTDVQLQALQPLVQNRSLEVITFTQQ